jgi:hypothetical protein
MRLQALNLCIKLTVHGSVLLLDLLLKCHEIILKLLDGLKVLVLQAVGFTLPFILALDLI